MIRLAIIAIIAVIATVAAAADPAGDAPVGPGSADRGSGGNSGSGAGSAGASDVTVICARTANPTRCFADRAAALPDFDKIRTPESPAFTLLGVSPSKIDRPTTPKQLTVALGGFLSDGGIAIPQSLAIELWPYWLVSHPKVSAADYQHRDRLTQLSQNVTVSLGTSTSPQAAPPEMATTELPVDTTLAVGARTFVNLTAKPVVDCRAEEAGFVKLATDLSATTDAEGRRLAAALASKTKVLHQAQIDAAARGHELTELIAKLGDDREAAAKAAPGAFSVVLAADVAEQDRLQAALGLAHEALAVATGEWQLATQALKFHKAARVDETAQAALDALCASGAREAKQGLIAELAVAATELFVDSKTSDRHFADAAVWATLAYESPGWSRVAVARGLSTKVRGSDRSTFFETGLRVIRAKDAYAFSLEVMLRAPDPTYRVAATVDYHLQDNTWLTFSFGRDFASGAVGSLFSLANIKFGAGDPTFTPRSAR